MIHFKGLILLVASIFISQCNLQTSQSSKPTQINVNQSTANKILFESTGPLLDPGWELFTVNSNGTGLTQLTNNQHLIADFRWSPNGQSIAFTSFQTGISLNLTLNVMNADGSNVRQISQIASTGLWWSADNQQIAFVSDHSASSELYLVNYDGSGEKQLTHGNTNVYASSVTDASWSPNGKHIAFIRLDQGYIVDINGTNETPLTPIGNRATAISWSPRGIQIACIMTEQQTPAIYTMLPDGSNIQKIVDIPDDYAKLEWSPNAQYIDYTQKNNGIVSLFVVDADGKNKHQVANDIAGASWSPDSKHIVYNAYDAQLRSSLYIVAPDGQNQKRLPGNNSFDLSPQWSPAQ